MILPQAKYSYQVKTTLVIFGNSTGMIRIGVMLRAGVRVRCGIRFRVMVRAFLSTRSRLTA